MPGVRVGGGILGALGLQRLTFVLVEVVKVLLLVLVPIHVGQRLNHVGDVRVLCLAVSANA